MRGYFNPRGRGNGAVGCIPVLNWWLEYREQVCPGNSLAYVFQPLSDTITLSDGPAWRSCTLYSLSKNIGFMRLCVSTFFRKTTRNIVHEIRLVWYNYSFIVIINKRKMKIGILNDFCGVEYTGIEIVLRDSHLEEIRIVRLPFCYV